MGPANQQNVMLVHQGELILPTHDTASTSLHLPVGCDELHQQPTMDLHNVQKSTSLFNLLIFSLLFSDMLTTVHNFHG